MATGTWTAGHTWKPGAAQRAAARKLTIADYSPLSRVQIGRLQGYLEAMISHTMELGCTCANRARGHQKGCTGVRITKKARAYLSRLKRKGVLR